MVGTVDEWNQNTQQFYQVDYQLQEGKDFTGRKVIDALNEVTSYGYSTSQPVPMWVALWNNRIAYPEREEGLDYYEGWFISTATITGVRSTVTTSLDKVYNAVRAVYNSSTAGQSWTTFAEDKVSIARCGRREGRLQNGSAEGQALAEDLRDEALRIHKLPRFVCTIEITGIAQRFAGFLDGAHRLRAGETVFLSDLGMHALMSHSTYALAKLGIVSLIMRTSYNESTNSVIIDLGSSDQRLEVLMGRLGLSGGLG
jgi:hypothetical protein